MNSHQIDVCGAVLAGIYGTDSVRIFYGGAVLVMASHGTNVLHTCLNAVRHGLSIGDVVTLYGFGRLIRRLA